MISCVLSCNVLQQYHFVIFEIVGFDAIFIYAGVIATKFWSLSNRSLISFIPALNHDL